MNQKIANGTYLIPTPQRIGVDGNGNPADFSTFSIPSLYKEDQFLINTDSSSRRNTHSRSVTSTRTSLRTNLSAAR